MAQGCLFGLLTGIGKLMVRLGYGSKGMKAREAAGKSDRALCGIMFLLAFCEFFLGVMLACLPTTAEEKGTMLLVMLVPVALYIAWVIYARISIKKLVAQYQEQLAQEELQEQEVQRENVRACRWECPSCGRINENTDIMCKDCGEYR